MDPKNIGIEICRSWVFVLAALLGNGVASAQVFAPWREYHDVIGETVNEMVDARMDANKYSGMLEKARTEFFTSEPGTKVHTQATRELQELLWRRDVAFLATDLLAPVRSGIRTGITSLAFEQFGLRMKGTPAEKSFNDWERALLADMKMGPADKLWSLGDAQVQQAFNHTSAAYAKYSVAMMNWEYLNWCANYGKFSQATLKKCEALTGKTLQQRQAAEAARRKPEEDYNKKRTTCMNAAKSNHLWGDPKWKYQKACLADDNALIAEQLDAWQVESNKQKISAAKTIACQLKPDFPGWYPNGNAYIEKCSAEISLSPEEIERLTVNR